MDGLWTSEEGVDKRLFSTAHAYAGCFWQAQRSCFVPLTVYTATSMVLENASLLAL